VRDTRGTVWSGHRRDELKRRARLALQAQVRPIPPAHNSRAGLSLLLLAAGEAGVPMADPVGAVNALRSCSKPTEREVSFGGAAGVPESPEPNLVERST